MPSLEKTSVSIFTVEKDVQLNILRQESLNVQFPLSSASKNTIENMIAAIKEKGSGYGLAAPQIGINENIIICSFTGDIDDLEVMINPTYVEHGDTKIDNWEGCFSIPHTVAKVSRWASIDVSYYTMEGNYINKQLNGFPSAIVFQHECDHLAGILMIDRASEVKQFSTEEEWNDFRQIIRAEREAAAREIQQKSSPKCRP